MLKNSDFGLILEDCKSLFSEISHAHTVFAKKSMNRLANSLARVADFLSVMREYSLSIPHEWFTQPPHSFADVLALDGIQ